MGISRITEEIFPFIHYAQRKKRLCQRSESSTILNCQGFTDYSTLPEEQLKIRLQEERERAQFIDEKTYKFILTLSIGLTVTGSIAVPFIRAVSNPTIQMMLTIIVGVSLSYVFVAGCIALDALRTFPSYGYGTQFLLELQKKKSKQPYLAEELARQETMNIIRHLRNETARQTLRNGLWLLFAAGTLIFVVVLTHRFFPHQHPCFGSSMKRFCPAVASIDSLIAPILLATWAK